MVDDAAYEGLTEPDQNVVKLLQQKLEEATKLKEEIDALNAKLKTSNTQFRDVRTKDLPDLMTEIGVTRLVVGDWDCALDDLVEGSWPKEPQKQEVAIAHLVELEADDLIKTTITLEFSKEEFDKATEVFEAIKQDMGLEPVMGTTVNHMTLQAFGRECLRKGVHFDEKKLGLFVGKIVKFKSVKTK